MPDIRDSKEWDRQLEDGLPECRLPYHKRADYQISFKGLTFDPVFCANCGRLQGVAPPTTTFMFFLCDPCVERQGVPEGGKEVLVPEFLHLVEKKFGG